MSTQTTQVKPVIQLTVTEIGSLWSLYQQETMTVCFYSFFLLYLKDAEIRALAEESMQLSKSRVHQIEEIFRAENFPIPAGFTKADVNESAPPLFHDPFILSFVYMTNRLSMINLGFNASNNVRLDVLDFFKDCLHSSTEMFGKAVRLMLAKGLYDRPPKMNYPQTIEFMHKESFLNGFFGKKRPLSAVELSEIFFNIERNYFAVLSLLGFAQVIKDAELKNFILRGKALSEKQIEVFNNLLHDEDLLGTVTVSMEVTESVVSPFSDKLIFSMVSLLNSVGVVLTSHALALSLRADLTAQYIQITAEIMGYAKDTFDLAVKRNWMEQPPLVTDRQALIHSR